MVSSGRLLFIELYKVSSSQQSRSLQYWNCAPWPHQPGTTHHVGVFTITGGPSGLALSSRRWRWLTSWSSPFTKSAIQSSDNRPRTPPGVLKRPSLAIGSSSTLLGSRTTMASKSGAFSSGWPIRSVFSRALLKVRVTRWMPMMMDFWALGLPVRGKLMSSSGPSFSETYASRLLSPFA